MVQCLRDLPPNFDLISKTYAFESETWAWVISSSEHILGRLL